MKFSSATITTIVALNALLDITPTTCFIIPAGRRSTPFATTTPYPPSSPSSSSSLNVESPPIRGDEDTIRSEIDARNNAAVEDEEKYTIPDGSDLSTISMNDPDIEEILSSPPPETTTTTTTTSPPPNPLSRALRERAYPLFTLEKLAQLIEDTLPSTSRPTFTTYQPLTTKERIVVVGTGWGSAAFLKGIDTSRYDVTVVSPRNFFLFTPMLAGASVGTVEYRSITEPVRQINPKVNYLEATVSHIDPATRRLTCEAVHCEGHSCQMDEVEITYDKLVLAVGARTNTFGIPGVQEYCNFLKSVEDAKAIRNGIVNLFERANFPGLTDEERERILTFAVIGAGPTGIEFASELRDFIENDGPKYYPRLLKHVRIKVIEASSAILAPFDKSLQNEAMRQLTRRVSIADPDISRLLPEDYELTELLLDSGVEEVEQKVIRLNNGQAIPYGLAVWAAGNGPLPVTISLIEALGEFDEENKEQTMAQEVARGRVAIDPWLRVLGSGGSIYSLGDCSCVVGEGRVPLPATAQVAAQQGEYLARLFSRHGTGGGDDDVFEEAEMTNGDADDATTASSTPRRSLSSSSPLPPPLRATNIEPLLSEQIAAFAMQNDTIAAPFQFLNLGILAYTGGGSALAQFQVTPAEKGRVKGTGKVGYGLWRSVYLTKQVSWRNRFLVFTDWMKATLFGRDITRV